jgi:hypothetical protein
LAGPCALGRARSAARKRPSPLALEPEPARPNFDSERTRAMKLTKSISRVLLAGALGALPAASALAEDTVPATGEDCHPMTQPQQGSALEQGEAAVAHAQAADEAQAKADHYDQRVELYESFGAVAYKTGELQRAAQSAYKYHAEAAEYRALAGEATPVQCAPTPNAPAFAPVR